ncbi:MAG: efflux RND transporter periplasmic adaptor subunit [Methylophilaceae bacterium]|nr:efflux RND transporter periplasmic adaptor subunit [Methylophilaceae bacterium]
MQIRTSRFGNKIWLILVIIIIALFLVFKHFSKPVTQTTSNVANNTSSSPALTVQTSKLINIEMDNTIEANGSIQPWQESIIGAEVSGLLLKEVLVNVGDEVKKGQTIAKFSSSTIEAELAQFTATLAEAKANYIEANSNAERARSIKEMGVLSRQQIDQFMSTEAVAKARIESAEANLNVQKIKLNQTVVTAPDAGIISTRTATVGAVANQGQELFRLIRQGRLEWRAEITSSDISKIKTNEPVTLTLPNGQTVNGKVRIVSPSIDNQTRNGLAFVDLPKSAAKAGMYARGSFHLSQNKALTLPANAIVLREGFAYVMQVKADHRIKQIKVKLARRSADRIEITSLKEDDLKDLNADFVSAGGAFLADGDLVRVVPNTLTTNSSTN